MPASLASDGAVGARYMEEARGAGVVCAGSRAKQSIRELAQRPVEIYGPTPDPKYLPSVTPVLPLLHDQTLQAD